MSRPRSMTRKLNIVMAKIQDKEFRQCQGSRSTTRKLDNVKAKVQDKKVAQWPRSRTRKLDNVKAKIQDKGVSQYIVMAKIHDKEVRQCQGQDPRQGSFSINSHGQNT